MTRKAKLEKALAFDRWFFDKNAILYNNDVINDAEKHHEKQLATLHEALVAAVEALEFYGDKENYGSDDTSRRTGNKCFDIVLFDFERGDKKDYAGSRARYTLSKIDKALGEI